MASAQKLHIVSHVCVCDIEPRGKMTSNKEDDFVVTTYKNITKLLVSIVSFSLPPLPLPSYSPHQKLWSQVKYFGFGRGRCSIFLHGLTSILLFIFCCGEVYLSRDKKKKVRYTLSIQMQFLLRKCSLDLTH